MVLSLISFLISTLAVKLSYAIWLPQSQWGNPEDCMCRRGPLARYVKQRVAHGPGTPKTFPRHQLQRKPQVSDPGMHCGTCVTPVSWCMSGSLTCDGGENVPGIPGACATRNFTYMARDPCAGITWMIYPLLIEPHRNKTQHTSGIFHRYGTVFRFDLSLVEVQMTNLMTGLSLCWKSILPKRRPLYWNGSPFLTNMDKLSHSVQRTLWLGYLRSLNSVTCNKRFNLAV